MLNPRSVCGCDHVWIIPARLAFPGVFVFCWHLSVVPQWSGLGSHVWDYKRVWRWADYLLHLRRWRRRRGKQRTACMSPLTFTIHWSALSLFPGTCSFYSFSPSFFISCLVSLHLFSFHLHSLPFLSSPSTPNCKNSHMIPQHAS